MLNNDGENIKICVASSEDSGFCGFDASLKAKDLGKKIAERGAVLLTGAGTGFSHWSAIGAKKKGGVVIGLSPFSNKNEHHKVHKKPTDYHDAIFYTGFGHSGRNIMLVRSADAVIVGCGKIGSMNEFTIAYEEGKPIGVLQGEWPLDKDLLQIIESNQRPSTKVVFDEDPERLLSRLEKVIREEKNIKKRVRG